MTYRDLPFILKLILFPQYVHNLVVNIPQIILSIQYLQYTSCVVVTIFIVTVHLTQFVSCFWIPLKFLYDVICFLL